MWNRVSILLLIFPSLHHFFAYLITVFDQRLEPKQKEPTLGVISITRTDIGTYILYFIKHEPEPESLRDNIKNVGSFRFLTIL